MNISYNWLQDYLPEIKNYSPTEVGDMLTSIGLEVASIEEVESIPGGLKGILIGKVLSCEDHPNSDHLHITSVDVGLEEPLAIVCGAPNVAQGQTVVVATIGAVLYSGGESFIIKKSKLRGEPSFGMICSEKELNLGEDTSGILVLDQEVAPGTPASEYFSVSSDYLIEVDITPNRVDATSHFGVARDLAARLSHLLQKEIRAVKPILPELVRKEGGTPISVAVEVDPQLCSRYKGITIEGVHVEGSPKWLQDRLKTVGLRSINSVVDIANYVLYEIGYPLHIFDADTINQNKIRVSHLPQGTPFTTLDGVERKLSGSEIMICDEHLKPLCMAGILGGVHSGVTHQTTRLFIEGGAFNSTSVRKSSRYHAISSDASFRFERGLDPEEIDWALQRTASMIIDICGGEVLSSSPDLYLLPSAPREIQLSYERVTSTIGCEIAKDQLHQILRSLDIEITDRSTSELLHLQVPGYRVDVARDVDVIEDILRIYGYNALPLSGYIHANLSMKTEADERVNSRKILSEQLLGMGFQEIMCNSLTSTSYFKDSTLESSQSLVHLENPLSSDLEIMRPSLLFGGLEAISRNINRQQDYCAFYEWGNIYFKKANETQNPLDGYSEKSTLGLWLYGNIRSNTWTGKEEHSDFFYLKGVVIRLFERMGISQELFSLEVGSDEFLSQKISFLRPDRNLLAEVGIVRPEILQKTEINGDVFFAQIYQSVLFDSKSQKKVESKELSKFPMVKRDFAFLIDRHVSYLDIEKLAYKTERKLLKKVELFDVYEGKNLPEGKKSYGMSFFLNDETATLKDKQIEAVMSRIRSAIETTFGAEIR